MAVPELNSNDVFLPNGQLRPELWTDAAYRALQSALRLAGETRWEMVRSPHLFMGLLAEADACVVRWSRQFGADCEQLLADFQELFHQADIPPGNALAMNREFLSDNTIRHLREAHNRAVDNRRTAITPMDLLISLLTVPNSVVAECFERTGFTAAKLTELAVIAEHWDD